ncbi:MAG: crossover junction endodeoxyribonuclease RuvC [Candidatus Omnitrophica bacterium]|nr:crossover junction endodeoxyribonuclease RuvC [Candidatus Omnitrophota bacterium]MBU1932858.1 crossover junction endodeoxyribonuclease RuvC [Candidatus Omnitrophota bacterium]
MRILGIDPGLAITGYGLIESSSKGIKVIEAGVIRSDARNKIEKRLSEIYGKVMALIKDTSPAVVALEELYSHYKHPRTSILMGHARGIICLAVEEQRVKLVNYPSTRVKKAVTGRGHASKQQIQRTVVNILGLKELPEPVDITDALALAMTHANVCLRKL